MASRNEFDKTIAETEGAYMKVRSLHFVWLKLTGKFNLHR